MNKEKHYIFMDGSGEGSHKFDCWVTVMVLLKNPMDLQKVESKILCVPKKVPSQLRNVLDCGEFKFNKYAPKLGTPFVKEDIKRRLKLLSDLESIEIHVKIIKAKSIKQDVALIKKHRLDFLSTYGKDNYSEIMSDKLLPHIFSDKNFFPLKDKFLCIGKKDGVPTIYLDGEDFKPSKEIKCFKVNHTDSKRSKGVQMADLISGAIFQEIERDNSEFWDIIKGKVKFREIYDDE